VGKLDPKALKCVFVGYPSTKKGYKCWCPSERKMFVSMDVTFRELEPYYSGRPDLSDLLVDTVSDNAPELSTGRSIEDAVIVPPTERYKSRLVAKG
jgi:hypothetical protein